MKETKGSLIEYVEYFNFKGKQTKRINVFCYTEDELQEALKRIEKALKAVCFVRVNHKSILKNGRATTRSGEAVDIAELDNLFNPSIRIDRFQDSYNSNKIWIIKRYGCGHYYANQIIKNRPFYKKDIRVRSNFLHEIESMHERVVYDV